MPWQYGFIAACLLFAFALTLIAVDQFRADVREGFRWLSARRKALVKACRFWIAARVGDYAIRLHNRGARTKAMRMARLACRIGGFKAPKAVKPHARTYAMIHELGPEDYRTIN